MACDEDSGGNHGPVSTDPRSARYSRNGPRPLLLPVAIQDSGFEGGHEAAVRFEANYRGRGAVDPVAGLLAHCACAVGRGQRYGSGITVTLSAGCVPKKDERN